ncbi:MAG TPA: gamma-glutamyltransferase family protein [Casimicrobiaceae bacterium]|nr:gamma-glutamyltransferase family protein [Casimicrobiaceae bacterium]
MQAPSFSWDLPYASRRMPVLARNVVATSQPLAAQAGLRMLLRGGNAVDAAVATAIALTVVEPTMNGIGGDCFAIVWDGERLHGLNGSGRSPAAWTPEHFAGLATMPKKGWDCVTVPGQIAGWMELSRKLGRLPFAELFEPAIAYARDGFIVSPTVARQWGEDATTYADMPDFAPAFLPRGRAPRVGETFALPEQARTLGLIAQTGGETFYRGEIAERIVAHAKANGGLMSLDDLATASAEWVQPIARAYRGYDLHELPPNGQGLAALIGLGILEHTNLDDYVPDSADSVHLQIEAMKLAFADVYAHIADPLYMELDYDRLLDARYLAERAKSISMLEARHPQHGVPPKGDTVYLTAADASGMMVSFIQSNYFTSGVVIPGTGISMQGRGACFSTRAGHPNQVGPRKRPFHTIIPAFLTREGRPVMSYGVMGSTMQPQGHVQLLVRLAHFGQNPQAASDAPRFRLTDGMNVTIEDTHRPEVIRELARRGHRVTVANGNQFGCAQLIYRLDDGYFAASDHRRDGQAVGF